MILNLVLPTKLVEMQIEVIGEYFIVIVLFVVPKKSSGVYFAPTAWDIAKCMGIIYSAASLTFVNTIYNFVIEI